MKAPASTGSVTPVMYRGASEARKSTALLTSTGSTHGIGSAWSYHRHPVTTSHLPDRNAGSVVTARTGRLQNA